MITKEKVINITSILKNDVSDDFTLEKSDEIVRYIFDRYFTNWNETRIREHAHLNCKLHFLLKQQHYTLTKEQKDLIEECATLMTKDILFKRVVETTNNIECPFKVQSKIKELLKGIALKQEYAEQYKTDSTSLFEKIAKDIKKDFLSQFYIEINGRVVLVYGELLIDYLKRNQLNTMLKKHTLQDLIFFRPENNYAIASKTLMTTLIVVKKEANLIHTLNEYRQYVELKILNAFAVNKDLTMNG